MPSSELKYDGGKPRMELLLANCPDTISDIADVLTFGANKYPDPDTNDQSWRNLHNAEIRYWAALYRHLNLFHKGEEVDQESGLPHLSHALCNLVFINELRK